MKRLKIVSENAGPILRDLCKERGEWSCKKREMALHHRHIIQLGEIVIFLGFVVLVCFHIETIRGLIQPLWKYIQPFVD